MSKRLLVLVGAMLVVGALLLFDRPRAALEVSEQAPRRLRQERLPQPAVQTPGAGAPAVRADTPVPDLFEEAAGPAPQGQSAKRDVSPEDAPALPFSLIGFKEEDGVREAYLMRNGEVLTVRAGATLEKRYRVLALRQDAVQIQDNQSGQQMRIAFEVE